jgi:transcriptional regulator GlxA family with amidase domain
MNPKIRSVIAFFDANLHRQIRMIEVAELSGLSHSRLDHLFKAEVGQSPTQYLQELRLKKACQILEATSLKITLVGLAVGYQDHSHFFRNFKKRFGLTPSQYRTQHLDKLLDAGTQSRK